MEDSSSSLSCNSCRAHIDGIAYRTSCLHLLCSACAKHSFADGRTCLICGTVLSKGKVKEVVIGVPAQVEISSSLFQMAFSSANLGSIVDNLDSMRHAFAELENLVSTQLLLETSQLQRSAGKALQDNEILHDQLNSAGVVIRAHEESIIRSQQDAEGLLHSKDTEISELKDAYKEKHRKCQAWEKAYNNIRDQVIVPNETSTTDKYKHPIPQFSSGYSAPLQNGGRRDHHQMAGMSNSDYQARDLIVPPSYSSRTGGVMEQRFPQSTQILSPTTHTVPTRTLRRTEVATYSKLFEPESMQTDNRQPPGQAAQLNFRPQNLPLNMKSGPGMQSQYFQSYSSPPIPQQVSTLILKNRTQPDSTPVTNYHRPESKRRHQSPNQDTVKSSFFD